MHGGTAIGRAFALAISVVALGASPALAGGRPATIPALREWQDAAGRYSLPKHPRVVAARSLQPTAKDFAASLRRLTGRRVSVVGPRAARRGDIHLRLGAADSQLGTEGYRLRIGRTVTARADDATGVFYATRTLLQLLAQGRTIGDGVARDWPHYPERGLMVDVGRKYFTPGWIKARIDEMALLKLNYLHLHLSDDQGFRIQSDTHPEIVSAQHLTKDEVRAIVALATRKHVIVVPEIDMPAHMGAELGPHPELRLTDISGQKQASKLDVTLPAARAFVKSLIEEYLPLFPGPYWHMGADEFIGIAGITSPLLFEQFPQLASYAQANFGPQANGQDAILSFINWVDDLVRAHGKTLRIWNDGLPGGSAVKAKPDIVVDWWTNGGESPSPGTVLDGGYRVANSGWYPTYYVNSSVTSNIPPRPDMKSAYEKWSVDQFFGEFYLDPTATFGPPPYRLSPNESRNLGAELNVWNDDPNYATQDQIAAAIAPRLRLIAQKTWDSPPVAASYADFEKIVTSR